MNGSGPRKERKISGRPGDKKVSSQKQRVTIKIKLHSNGKPPRMPRGRPQPANLKHKGRSVVANTAIANPIADQKLCKRYMLAVKGRGCGEQ